jgi:hypothetical protein
MPVTPSDPTPAELLALQALLDRSTRTATPAVADSVAYPARQMSAAEFVEFWRSVRLVAMATVGPAGQPHIAPVHVELAGTMLRLRIYEDTVRRQDLATNPRVAFTTPPGLTPSPNRGRRWLSPKSRETTPLRPLVATWNGSDWETMPSLNEATARLRSAPMGAQCGTA